MSDLPAGWTTVALGDVTSKPDTWSPSDSSEKFTYVDIASVDTKTKRIVASKTLPMSEAPSRARQLLRSGDVAVSTVRPNLNGVAAVPATFDGAIGSTGFSILRPGPEIDPSYLAHWVTTDRFVNALMQHATGQSYPAVSDKKVRATYIPLPPLDEQRRIATILDTATALSERAAEAMRAATSFAASLFRQMFGTPARPQGNAIVAPFGELLKVSSGQFLPASAMNPDGAHPVYGGNGQNGVHNEYLFDEPKVVIGRVGAYCGAVHVTEPKSWVSDNALYVKSTSHPLVPQFLALSLQQVNLNQYANQSGQPSISAKKLAHVPILVAPQFDQDDFEKRLSAFRAIETGITSRMTETTNLASSLQSRAFRGEL